jgi:D-alanyl-D-alanine carboxypeptidase
MARARPQMTQLVGVLVLLFGLACLPVSASAAKYASLVMDADTGTVLYARSADRHRYPASLTKMMTLYMVFEALEDGRLKLRQPISVSARAAAQPPSKLAIKPGNSIIVEDAILALVTKSANDVATAIAEELGGTERNFALAMTATARKLGMSRTTFRNASGLPHKGQLTTARDMAKLARALLRRFPEHYHYFSVRSFEYGGARYRNHNRMLGNYDGLDGIKTGYINASGFNLVASAVRDNRRLIGVVFGAKNPKRRGRHMAKLLDEGFRVLPTTVVAQRDQKRPLGARVAAVANDLTALSGPAPRPEEVTVLAPPASSGGVWAIQVGAYHQPQPARKIARVAYNTAAEYLRGGTVTVVRKATTKPQPYYLARIQGIGRNEAQQACRKLRGKGMDCLKLRLQGTSPARTVVKMGGSWGVQVGAYPKRTSASRIAQKVVDMVPNLLEEGLIKVVPLTKGKRRPLYRARILGIDKKQAYEACRQLEAEKVPCMVLQVKGVQTASARD